MTNDPIDNLPASKWPQVRIDPKAMQQVDDLIKVVAISRSQAVQMCITIGADALLEAYGRAQSRAATTANKTITKQLINLGGREVT